MNYRFRGILSQRRHQDFAIHVLWEDHKKSAAASRQGALDSWDPTTSLSSIRYKEGQMDSRWALDPVRRHHRTLITLSLSPSRLRFLLDNAGPVSCQSYVVIPRLESWVDDSESIVLIGEAAHPQGVRACMSFTLLSPFSPFCLLSSSSSSLFYLWGPRASPERHMHAASPSRTQPSSAHYSLACGAGTKSRRFCTHSRTCTRGARTLWQR